MKLRFLAYGLATYLPGGRRLLGFRPGATDDAAYCYSVWLRHLILANQSGLAKCPPASVGELGPGDSLGTGIAALISGSERYIALDVVNFADAAVNLAVFDDLVKLFKNRSPVPSSPFPNLHPSLDHYEFPTDIFSHEMLAKSLSPARLDKIRRSIVSPDTSDSMIEYRAPWNHASVISDGSLDMIFSQAVLEHVDDLQSTYAAMHRWLGPTGFVSHQIDYTSHNIDKEWNGHWKYSDWTWRLMRGRREYLLNRAPHSEHVKRLQSAGFQIAHEIKTERTSNLTQADVARRFSHLSDTDLTTNGAFLQAVATPERPVAPPQDPVT